MDLHALLAEHPSDRGDVALMLGEQLAERLLGRWAGLALRGARGRAALGRLRGGGRARRSVRRHLRLDLVGEVRRVELRPARDRGPALDERLELAHVERKIIMN